MQAIAIRNVLGALALGLTAAGSAQAGNFTLSGNIAFHNDVVQIDFSLAAPAVGVTIWTDSWQSGLNFDPVAAVWLKTGGDATLQAQVDDDDSIAAGQGAYDSGFNFATLAAGNYRLTIAASFNAANGTLLSQGFAYGQQTPIPLSIWNQPSYDPNANDQKGGFWQVHLSGVDSVGAVPEPASAWLITLGAIGLALKARRKNA